MTDQNDNGGVENALHASFLESAPEEYRDAAEALVPVWDKYVQDKFQEHADYRKRYEPLTDVSDEEIQDYLSYRERVTAGETEIDQIRAAKEWWDDYGAQLRERAPDLFQDQTPSPDFAGDGYETDPAIQQYIQQMESRIAGLEGHLNEQTQNQRYAEAADFVQGELDKIRPQFAGDLAPEAWDAIKDDICALASRYDTKQNDFIEKGFADYQRIVNDTERSIFDRKLNHPKPAESGGTTEARTGPPISYDDANDAAKMRIREAMKHGR